MSTKLVRGNLVVVYDDPIPRKEPHLAMFDDPDFGKCYSCKYQIEPFRMCEWAEHGGDGVVHLKCPRWGRKDAKQT